MMAPVIVSPYEHRQFAYFWGKKVNSKMDESTLFPSRSVILLSTVFESCLYYSTGPVKEFQRCSVRRYLNKPVGSYSCQWFWVHKLNGFFGYFDPITIFVDNINKWLSGWPVQYIGTKNRWSSLIHPLSIEPVRWSAVLQRSSRVQPHMSLDWTTERNAPTQNQIQAKPKILGT